MSFYRVNMFFQSGTVEMKLYQALILIVLFGHSLFSDAQVKNMMGQLKPHSSFTILQYHHISDRTPSITSTLPEIFEEHLKYINEKHKVITLENALDAVKNDFPMPSNSVVITFDDGYLSIFENAHTLLKKYNMPYTVFINPDEIGRSHLQLNWQQIKEMKPLATFANHTLDHIHLVEKIANETDEMWLTRIIQNIQSAEKKIESQLGYSKKWLAYPYGEFNAQLKNALLKLGYVGFAQHSGAVNIDSDFGALPRFPAAGIYANLDTLKVKMKSLPMPIAETSIHDPVMSVGEALHSFTVKTLPLKHWSANLSASDMKFDSIACYFKGESIPVVTQNNTTDIEMNVTLAHTFGPGRIRVNCTAPSKSLKGRYYWYSQPFFVPTEKGKFLE